MTSPYIPHSKISAAFHASAWTCAELEMPSGAEGDDPFWQSPTWWTQAQKWSPWKISGKKQPKENVYDKHFYEFVFKDETYFTLIKSQCSLLIFMFNYISIITEI